MGAYLGDEKFASGGGTINVTAHQFTNNVSDVKMNGVASLGVLDTIVRADHVHPSDTSREPAFTKNTAFNKNFETSTTEIKANGAVSVGSSNNIARADHVHPFSDAETFAESERTKANNATYGAIVHQKEMESYAQPLVTTVATDISSSTLTTLGEYIEFFDENYPNVYRAGVGANQSSNLKTLLTDPFGETETFVFISPEVHGSGLNYKVWKVMAVARFSGKLAVGYLRKWFDTSQTPGVAGYIWTGWTNLYT